MLFWFPPTFNPTVAVKTNQELCHILKSPPAGGALLVRLESGATDGGLCKRPSSGSFHSTSAPAPFFCLITNLSCGLPPSSHLAGCYADGALVASHGHTYKHEDGKLKPGSDYCCFRTQSTERKGRNGNIVGLLHL